MTEDLRSRIDGEEFDYLALLNALGGYARPRDRITELLRRGEIVRVKKGIYVFGPKPARRPFSREVLANLLCGPSYVSLDSALYHHGLIPARPEAVLSVTCGRSRSFSTPVGLFVYRSIPLRAYRFGFDRVALAGGPSFLIATPEKALADKVYDEKGLPLLSRAALRRYLLETLRIDPKKLTGFDTARLTFIAEWYRSRKVWALRHLLWRLSAGLEAP